MLGSLAKQAFDPNMGLFQFTKDRLLYPNPHKYAREEQQLRYFRFLGRLVGKALYDGFQLDASFATFFLTKLLGRISYCMFQFVSGQTKSIVDELPSLDPELYKNLIFLKNYAGDVEELALNFTCVSEGKKREY
jgi:ubiquitin-protein ligase E3 C